MLSPAKTFLFGPLGRCRFTPSCSEYALEALRRHGALAGSWLALKRIGRCHPWGGCGMTRCPTRSPKPKSEAEVAGTARPGLPIPSSAAIPRLTSMDRKSIIVLVVCFLVLMLWYPLVVNKLYPPKPLPPGATNAPAGSCSPPPTRRRPPRAAPPVLEQPAPAPKPVVTTNVPEELLEVTNDNARYTFTSHGGGLKLVELLHYPETVSARRKKGPQTNDRGHVEHVHARADAGAAGRRGGARRRHFPADQDRQRGARGEEL